MLQRQSSLEEQQQQQALEQQWLLQQDQAQFLALQQQQALEQQLQNAMSWRDQAYQDLLNVVAVASPNKEKATGILMTGNALLHFTLLVNWYSGVDRDASVSQTLQILHGNFAIPANQLLVSMQLYGCFKSFASKLPDDQRLKDLMLACDKYNVVGEIVAAQKEYFAIQNAQVAMSATEPYNGISPTLQEGQVFITTGPNQAVQEGTTKICVDDNIKSDITIDASGSTGQLQDVTPTTMQEHEATESEQKLTTENVRTVAKTQTDVQAIIKNAITQRNHAEFNKQILANSDIRKNALDMVNQALLGKKCSDALVAFVNEINLDLVELKQLKRNNHKAINAVVQRRIAALEQKHKEFNLVVQSKIAEPDQKQIQESLLSSNSSDTQSDIPDSPSIPASSDGSSSLVRTPEPEIKPSFKQQVVKSINDSDFSSFNQFMQNKKKKQDVIAILTDRLSVKNQISDEFLQKIELSFDQTMVLLGKKLNTANLVSLLYKVLNFCCGDLGFAEYHQHKAKILRIFEINDLENKNLELAALRKATDAGLNAWVLRKIDAEFQYLESLSPGDEISLKRVKYALDQIAVNGKDESLLLVAFRRQLKPTSILELMQKLNDDTFLVRNDMGQNVFHYWAQYLTQQSLELILKIFDRHMAIYASRAKAGIPMKSNIPAWDNKENTFMHILAQTYSDEKLVLSALDIMFNSKHKELIYAIGILTNQNGQTAYSMLDKNEIDMPNVRTILGNTLVRAAFAFVEASPDNLHVFFRFGKNFYQNNSAPLVQMLKTYDIKRIVATIKARYDVYTQMMLILGELLAEYNHRDDKQAVLHRYSGLINYFSTSELLVPYNNVPLYSNIVDAIIYALYQENADKFEGVLHAKFVDFPAGKLTNKKTLEEFAKLEELMAIDPVIGEVSKDLHINNTISWKCMKIHQLTNSLAKLKPAHKEFLKRHCQIKAQPGIIRAHDFAIMSNSLEILCFLHKECGAKFDYVSIVLALDAVDKNPQYGRQVVEYVLDNCRLPNNHNDDSLIQQVVLSMQTAPSEFDINLTTLQWLLFDPVRSKKMLTHKNKLNQTIISTLMQILVQKTLDLSQIYLLLKLFLEHGAELNDHALFDAFEIADQSILELYLKHIPKDRLESILKITNAAGKTIIEVAKDRFFGSLACDANMQEVCAKLILLAPSPPRSTCPSLKFF